MRIGQTWLRILGTVALGTLFALTGCMGSDGGHADLQQFVNEVKARKGSRIAPMPEFQMYEGFEYSAFDRREPFTLAGMDAERVPVSNNGISPNQDRHKEPLEQFPLDTLNFAGHLEKKEQKWAILTAPDGLVHRVQVGNHLGQNYGRITNVTETRIELVEIVPDGIGGWIEREAALALDSEE
ncbi:pilus assembly protein PilP [Thiohalomonas denitrificans]|uniref:Type IV pilus assembly protein PilP n=1 Tax=Thiohalomonas denitrificans TaxID=415747 RepID=A0A1G5QWI8_9GAMM|nr:pilus assembly protein PilP [Thiohalomonas denitrificans]SCZ66213.1 type IV pilus assembly protein PilP [Thiohalomonas denitrificans]